MQGDDGFTGDVVEGLCAVPGVHGVWHSSWSGVFPLLLMSSRTSQLDVYRVIADRWRAPRVPSVRAVLYDDREVTLEDRLEPAHGVVDRLADLGVLVDVVYPVPQYRRVYLELSHQGPDRFSAEWSRLARRAAAETPEGAWPIEVRDRPWVESVSSLDRPPPGWQGPAPLLGRAPAWVDAALHLVHDRLVAVVGPSAAPDVSWSPDQGHPVGRIHGRWSDGPVGSVVEAGVGGA